VNATLSKKLRFSDAVHAMQTKPKTLRNWLQRNLVELDTPRSAGDQGWAEYSFTDIALLVLTKTFADFGFSVPDASTMARRTLDQAQQPFMSKPENAPAQIIYLWWAGRVLHVFRNPAGEWRLSVARDAGAFSTSAQDRAPPPSYAFLTIDVRKILQEAFARADESNNEGGDQ